MSSTADQKTQSAGSADGFKTLSAHETQKALATALEASIDKQATDPGPKPDEDFVEGRSKQPEIVLMTSAGEEGEGEEAESAAIANPFAVAAQSAQHVRMVEALLFAAVEPLDVASLAARLPAVADVEAVLEILKSQYQNRGIQLQQIKSKYLFVTASDLAPLLEEQRVQPKKLSRAAMETLAIIAYHQPCTRAQIEEIRGVSVSKGSLDLLLEIGWLRLRGRREDTPGKPLLYGTTTAFLEHFGLEKISHLPGLSDLKAAGLLDARLPPGFEVPIPEDIDELHLYDEEREATDFVRDFHDDVG